MSNVNWIGWCLLSWKQDRSKWMCPPLNMQDNIITMTHQLSSTRSFTKWLYITLQFVYTFQCCTSFCSMSCQSRNKIQLKKLFRLWPVQILSLWRCCLLGRKEAKLFVKRTTFSFLSIFLIFLILLRLWRCYYSCRQAAKNTQPTNLLFESAYSLLLILFSPLLGLLILLITVVTKRWHTRHWITAAYFVHDNSQVFCRTTLYGRLLFHGIWCNYCTVQQLTPGCVVVHIKCPKYR